MLSQTRATMRIDMKKRIYPSTTRAKATKGKACTVRPAVPNKEKRELPSIVQKTDISTPTAAVSGDPAAEEEEREMKACILVDLHELEELGAAMEEKRLVLGSTVASPASSDSEEQRLILGSTETSDSEEDTAAGPTAAATVQTQISLPAVKEESKPPAPKLLQAILLGNQTSLS